MARILCIDYGTKKCGIAVTDPLQLIVNPLDAIRTSMLELYLEEYIQGNQVEKIIVGLPKHKDGRETFLAAHIKKLVNKLITKYSSIKFEFADESHSSKLAKKAILTSGVKKKKRKDKLLVDKISAAIILQRYLGHF